MVPMYKLVRYGVAQLSNLEQEVNSLLKDGWHAVGELKLLPIDGQTMCLQQMEYGRHKDKDDILTEQWK